MIEDHGDLREAIHDLPQQPNAFLLHLHADRDALGLRMLPEWIAPWIGKPGRLVRQRGAGREQAHAGASAAEPIVESLQCIGREHVDRIDAGEALRHCRHCVRDVTVVVAVRRRRMHDGRPRDAGVLHGVEQHLVCGRPLARPGRLRAAERGQRVFLGVGRDDVGMDIDDRGHAALQECVWDASGVHVDEDGVELRTRRDQFLLQGIGHERLDARPIGRHAVRQGIVHQREETAVALVLRTVAAAETQVVQIAELGGREGRHHLAHQPGMSRDHLVLHDDQAVDGVDACSAIPFDFDLLDLGDELGIGAGIATGRGIHVPVADRRPGAADARGTGEARLDLARSHHALQRFALGRVHDIGRKLERADMLLVVDNPGDLRGVQAVFVHEYSARPHAGGHGIGADADFLPLEILWLADARVRPHDEAAMMEAPHQEDRQRDVGRAPRPRDHVGRRSHLADVEFDVTHHAAKGLDDRHDLDEVGIDALNRDVAVLDCACVSVAADRDLQSRSFRSRRNGGIHGLDIHVWSSLSFNSTGSECLPSR